jgi:hypothetical protein
MWRRRDFAILRKCSPADLLLLLEAGVWLGVARAAILTIPFRWIARLFALTPGELANPHEQSPGASARRIRWAIAVVSCRTPWESKCLAQALAASAMLRMRRIPATMALGVARSAEESGKMEAHAWLSAGDLILTGGAGRERFTVIAKFSMGKSRAV